MNPAQAARVRTSHLSIDAACDMVKANETAELSTVVLLHLSNANSLADAFCRANAQNSPFRACFRRRQGFNRQTEQKRNLTGQISVNGKRNKYWLGAVVSQHARMGVVRRPAHAATVGRLSAQGELPAYEMARWRLSAGLSLPPSMVCAQKQDRRHDRLEPV